MSSKTFLGLIALGVITGFDYFDISTKYLVYLMIFLIAVMAGAWLDSIGDEEEEQ